MIHFLNDSVDLMELLVTSQDLCVIQTEFSLYVLLKFWLFLLLHPSWEGSAQEGISRAHQYFHAEAGRPVAKRYITLFYGDWYICGTLSIAESDMEFLLRDIGNPYFKAFQGLRLASLIGHPQDVDMIHGDRIIPASLLLPGISNILTIYKLKLKLIPLQFSVSNGIECFRQIKDTTKGKYWSTTALLKKTPVNPLYAFSTDLDNLVKPNFTSKVLDAAEFSPLMDPICGVGLGFISVQ